MLRREFNSDNNMKARRKPSFAETSRCTANADMVTPAHMLTDPTNSKRSLISQVTSWQNYVYNSMKKARVLMAKDANISTQTTTSRLNLHTPKPWKREADLLILETSRSTVIPLEELTAYGPTWRPQMDVEHQRCQDFQSLSKSTTRKSTTPNSMMRTSHRNKTSWREPTQAAQWTTRLHLRTSLTSLSNNRQWTIIITQTIIIIWDTKLTICRTTPSSKIIRETIKCTTNNTNRHNIITIIITADNSHMSLNHPATQWTKASSRSGLESVYI